MSVPLLQMQVRVLIERVDELDCQVRELRSLLTPEQLALADLLRKAERVVDVAIAEGQLEVPPL